MSEETDVYEVIRLAVVVDDIISIIFHGLEFPVVFFLTFDLLKQIVLLSTKSRLPLIFT